MLCIRRKLGFDIAGTSCALRASAPDRHRRDPHTRSRKHTHTHPAQPLPSPPCDPQTNEFAQENLDFFRAVLKYRANPTAETLVRIVDTFVDRTSAKQINLDAETREALLRARDEALKTGAIGKNTFDDAFEWIETLLKVRILHAIAWIETCSRG